MIQGQDLRAGARALPEKVMLVANKKNVDLIGVLPLEEYVAGVLASEVPLSWPMETLKAQAVAIRSYTMAVMQERQSRDFHVESTVMDQVFNHDPALSTSKNHKAVEATRATEGVVLYGPDQKVLKAFYHADCGGHTTAAKNVWKGGVDSGVAVDSSCPTRPRSHWSFKISREALIKRLHIASISSLTLLRAHGESRVEAVQVAMNDGAHKVIEANQFRQMLGFKDLRSTLFDMKEEARHIVFVGRGFGHGVGLCQWGSRALGLAGEKFQDILKHYYPLARLD